MAGTIYVNKEKVATKSVSLSRHAQSRWRLPAAFVIHFFILNHNFIS